MTVLTGVTPAETQLQAGDAPVAPRSCCWVFRVRRPGSLTPSPLLVCCFAVWTFFIFLSLLVFSNGPGSCSSSCPQRPGCTWLLLFGFRSLFLGGGDLSGSEAQTAPPAVVSSGSSEQKQSVVVFRLMTGSAPQTGWSLLGFCCQNSDFWSLNWKMADSGATITVLKHS